MEKDFECHSAPDNLLSQSYCNGIQKIAGTENAITNNFHVSDKILDKREKAWNNLFQKYSTMVSEVELNINTLQLEEPVNLPEVMEQRLPMRKSMSMVQFWVDTGNLIHLNCTNDSIHSDSGSSFLENDCCEPNQNIDTQSLTTDPSAEKHSNIAETSGNKNVQIATPSNSSVDTAAYILANNNITKKAETLAIVEGSKVDTETYSPVISSTQIIEISKNTNKISLAQKSNHEKSEIANDDFSQSFFFKSCIDKINENLKNVNFDKICKNKMSSKLKFQQNNICSIFFSDSDESISNIQNNEFQNVLNENNQKSDNVSKFLKRKKLYNQSDSPAEFTPVSEDNVSLQTSKVILRKCLPLRKSEHPALETPKTRPRFLSHARYRQTKFKRKLNRRQHFSSISTSDENQELLVPNQNNQNSHTLYNSEIQNTRNCDIQRGSKRNCITDNNLMLSQTSSGNHIHTKESNIQNSMNSMSQLFLNQPNKVRKPITHRMSFFSSCNEFLKNKFKLKSCRIVVQRLPYKYYLSNPSENSIKKKNLLDSVKSKKMNDVNKNLLNYALTSNIVTTENAKDLSENTFRVKAINVKTLNTTKTFRDLLNCKEKEKKSVHKTSANYSSSNIRSTEKMSTKHIEMTYSENSYKEKSKYVIANSSSDESDLIVPLSSAKNKSVNKSRKSKKLSNKHSSYNECSNTTDEDSNQSCSNKQINIIRKIGRNNDTDDDAEYNEMKENILSRELRHEIPAKDCKSNQNKIKNTLVTSSSNEEVSMPTKEKNQAVDLVTKDKRMIESTSAIINEFKNTSNCIGNPRVLINRIQEINNKVDINKKLYKLVITHDETKTLEKMRNERKLSVTDKSFSSDNSGDGGTLSNSISDKKLPHKISSSANVENSRDIQSNKSSPTKQIQRRDKSQRMQDSAKVKTAITQKTSIKKRKSFEIDLSSDEECIIPLKKKE